MLIVTLQNITPIERGIESGDADSKYKAHIYINKTMIHTCEVDHHDRMDGWEALLIKLATESLTRKAFGFTRAGKE